MKKTTLSLLVLFLFAIGCAQYSMVYRPYENNLRAPASAVGGSCNQLIKSILGISLKDGVALKPGYNSTVSAFDSALGKLPKKKATSVRDFVETLVAFDYDAVAKESLEVFTGKKTFGGSIFGRRRVFGEPAIDINNYKKALKEIQKRGNLTSSKIFKVHKALVGSGSMSKEGEAAIEAALATFSTARKKLKTVKTDAQVEKLIYLLVDLEKEVAAASAFKSHNDETARLVINSLLEAEGLAPARAYDLSLLKGMSRDEHYSRLRSGVISTKLLIEDLTDRILLDLPLENSPELFFPGVPRAYSIGFKKSGRKIVLEGTQTVQTDARQFHAFVMTQMKKDSGLEEAFKSDPSGVMKELAEDYAKFANKNHVIFTNAKGVKEDIRLSLIDADFVHMWARVDATNPEVYAKKMSRYYTDELLYRGHAYGWENYDEEGILNMFRIVERQVTSIRSGRRYLSKRGRAGYKSVAEQQKAMREWIIEEFDMYNQELVDGELYKMVDDHMRVGPRYKAKESYGYSTTKVYAQGKSFAKGKTLADYGKRDVEDIRIASRIVAGVRRGSKDVDMARLKQFDERFSYIYPRQQEIMGVGGAEPDSVVFIQELDNLGEVARTYLRDKDNPAKIWIIEGDYRQFGKKPPAARVIKEHILK